MTLSGDQAAAVKATVDAVMSDIDGHSQDFFIFYLKQHPGDIAKFPNYKGKAVDSLKSVPQFPSHVKGVVSDVFNHFAIAGDAAALSAKAKQTKKDHVPRNVGHTEFGNLLSSLTPYLQQHLGGSFNAGAWGAASALILNALD